MSVIANRYIQALLSLPKTEQENENLEKSLKEISQLLNENQELKKVLQDPRVNSDTKIEIMKEIFPEYSQSIFIKFLTVLIKEKRIDCIQEIAEGYEKINQKARKELEIKIILAKEIEENQINAILDKFKKIYGVETIKHEIIIDESLLGGIKIIVGNEIYDSSIATQLNQMF